MGALIRVWCRAVCSSVEGNGIRSPEAATALVEQIQFNGMVCLCLSSPGLPRPFHSTTLPFQNCALAFEALKRQLPSNRSNPTGWYASACLLSLDLPCPCLFALRLDTCDQINQLVVVGSIRCLGLGRVSVDVNLL